jgi:hypothetical protein
MELKVHYHYVIYYHTCYREHTKASDSTGKTDIFAVHMFNINLIYGPMEGKL